MDDYIFQNLIKKLQENAEKAKQNSLLNESTLYKSAIIGFQVNENEEISNVIHSLYSILNRKNFEEIRTLFQPDDTVKLLLPGYDCAVGLLLLLMHLFIVYYFLLFLLHKN